ncbi:MAG TPA: TetR/AcrR family transcriptional regulator [Candidatus Acidoferrum sp.]|nr:TetR/AcrR family transcriptional regulator [Candidatus Acidoferrum sp.]
MKKEKSTRRKEQGEATKKKISETAQRLFVEHGVENVTVDDIVTEVGVVRGTFYVHFESKDALISSLLSSRAVTVDAQYEAFLETLPPDMPSAEILLKLAEKICDVIAQDIGFETIKTVYKVQMTSAPNAQDTSGYDRAVYRMMSEVLTKGVSRGEFRADLAPEELSRHLVLAIRGLTYEWCIRYPDFDYKRQTLAHFKLLLEGILAKK